jgi:hypothetical protein
MLVACSIVIYFWILVPFFKMPAFLSEYIIVRLPIFALGVIFVKLFGQTDNSLLKARYKTKKLVTSYGVFEWDGSVREVQSGSQKFYVFYEGINADSIYQRGNKVFICPVDMAKKAGHNWLLKANLTVNKPIPKEFEQYTVGMDFCLYGAIPAADFGEVSVTILEIESRIALQDDTIKRQRLLLSDCLKMLSDKHAVKNLGSDEVIDKIEKMLKGGQS